MRGCVQMLSIGSRTISYMLGGLVLMLAATVMMSSLSVFEITAWAHNILGFTFIALLGGLIFTALICWVQIAHHEEQTPADQAWLEGGIQAANGVVTLALTYTLLGISLGIGSLAGKELTPDTVQVVIRGLTENFSLAFMTTVVGLPVSAVLRTLLLVTSARKRQSPAV